MFKIENATPTYDDVKKRLISLQKDLNSCKANIRGLDNQHKVLEQEKEDINQRFEINISNEKRKELQKYTDEISEPFSKKVDELEEALEDLQERFQEELANFSDDHLTDYYYDKREMLEEMKKVLDMLNEKIQDLLGERFLNELDAQLNSISIEIPEGNLEEICDYFDKEASDLEKIKEKDNKILSVEKIVGKVNSLGTMMENGNKQLILALLIILCIVFYFAFKFVFPIYVFLLFLYAIYNVKLSSKIRTIAILRKAILDNVSEIENMYREKAKTQLKEKREELTRDYESKKSDLEKKLDDADEKLQNVLLSAQRRFNFDDSDLKSKHHDLLLINESNLRKLSVQKVQAEERLKSLTEDYNKTKELFNTVANNIKNEYIGCDHIGTSSILDGKFLIDIDSVSKKPKFWQFNLSSNLILYDNISDVINFVKLIVVQLRTKLSPLCLNVSVYDSAFMCQDYLPFKDDKNENIMKFLISDDQLKTYMETLSELSIKRINTIKKEFDSIVEYNQFMLEQDSIPEPYTFFFIQDLDFSRVLENKFTQILLNGGALGIYFIIFMNKDTFYHGKEQSKELIKYFSKIFSFEPDTQADYEGSNITVKARAKDYVQDRMIEK